MKTLLLLDGGNGERIWTRVFEGRSGDYIVEYDRSSDPGCGQMMVRVPETPENLELLRKYGGWDANRRFVPRPLTAQEIEWERQRSEYCEKIDLIPLTSIAPLFEAAK